MRYVSTIIFGNFNQMRVRWLQLMGSKKKKKGGGLFLFAACKKNLLGEGLEIFFSAG